MQRLSLGSSAGRPRPSTAAEGPEGADEKAAKAVVRAAAAAAPDKSIHLVPVLTLLCFLVLFLLSHDPSASAAAHTDSPVLAATARSLEAAAAGGGGAAAGATTASVGARGVHRRLKEDHGRGRRMGPARGGDVIS